MASPEVFSLYRNYSSHMVVQRDRPVVFAGRGRPGKVFRLTFAGHTRRGVVGPDGRWQAEFPPLPAGGPWSLTAACGDQTLELEDVMSGEVWFCSGQSNMEMPVDSADPHWRALNGADELADADYPDIRLFDANATRSPADAPREDEVNPDGWRRCSAATARNFSALAFFFARRLHQDLEVPVGVVNCCWGGTDIKAWISRDAYLRHDVRLPSDAEQAQAVPAQWAAYVAADASRPVREWLERFDALGATPPEWLAPDCDDDDWETGERLSVDLPTPRRTLFRLKFDLDPAWAGREAVLEFAFANDMDRAWLNGQEIGATDFETPMYWAQRRRYPVPAGALVPGRNCLAVQVDDHYSMGALNAQDACLRCGDEVLPLAATVRWRDVFVMPESFPPRPPVLEVSTNFLPDSPNHPSALFNGMVAPWLRYPVRGVLWYQGCNNNGQLDYYRFHQMLIDDWRAKWRAPAMPFIVVQLAGFHEHQPATPMSAAAIAAIPLREYPPYAVTREIQAEMPRCRENVGLVTAFDRGEANDIHPRDKQTPATRLALKAEAMLGLRTQVADGPEFAGWRKEGGAARVFFRNVGSGLATSDGEAPKGFILGDAAGGLYWAEARLDGDTVVVSSPMVPDPQRVRYAFAGICEVNLQNREGFPALPFRSDKPDYAAMFAGA